MRVTFPLWAKLGLLFGGTIGLAIAAAGWVEFQTGLARERKARQAHLEGIAHTVASAIEPSEHSRIARGHSEDGYARLGTWVRLTAKANDIYWIGSSTRDDRGRWTYVLDSSPTPQPVGYPLFDGIPERKQAWNGDIAYNPAMDDEWGLWHTAFAPIRDGDRVVGVVEVAADAERLHLWAEERRRELFLRILLAVIGAFALSSLFARRLSNNLQELTGIALEVAGGRLDRRAEIGTRDEIGVLGRAFNQMVAGLEERDFIRDTFGRFVDRDVVDRLLANKELQLGGEARTVTVMMSDLRGFTALSGELGAERMVALLNRFFTAMAEVIEIHEGTIGEFVGDGIVTFFGAPVSREDDARRAVRCAVAMQRRLQRFCADEQRSFEMGIGLDTGVVFAGNIGSERQMKYGVVGEAINLAARLESFTLGNQVLVTEATLAAAGPLQTGDVQIIHAKGRSEPVRCYPVHAVDEIQMPDVAAEPTVAGQWEAEVWRIEGKEVAQESVSAVVRALGMQTATLDGVDLSPRDKIKLTIVVDGQRLEDLYATVADAAGGVVSVRFSSVPMAAVPVLTEATSMPRSGGQILDRDGSSVGTGAAAGQPEEDS